MAISSPTVVQQAGGGSDLMQGLAIAQQGFATMKQLEHMRAELDHKRDELAQVREQFRADGKEFIIRNPELMSVTAQIQPELVRSYLADLGIDEDSVDAMVSDMGSFVNMNLQQQQEMVARIANALGKSLEDFQEFQQQPEAGRTHMSPGAGVRADPRTPQAPGPTAPQYSSIWEPGTGAALTPEPEGAREGLYAPQPPGTRHQAETERGRQLTEGAGPSEAVQEQQRAPGAPGTRHGAMSMQRQALSQQLDTFVQNPQQAQEVVQVSDRWLGTKEGFEPFRKANEAAGLFRSDVESGDRSQAWDRLTRAIRDAGETGDWGPVNRITPRVNDLKTDADVAKVRRFGFVDERGQVTQETLRDYTAWRAILHHKARIGEDVNQINHISPEELRTEYFWATDRNLDTADIHRLNNIDVFTEAGQFDRQATLRARREEYQKILLGKQQIDEAGAVIAQSGSLPTSELQFRSALPQGQYRRFAASVANYTERVTNARSMITGKDLESAAKATGNLDKALGGMLRAIPESERSAYWDQLAATFNATINNTPGGLPGMQQALNDGYSLEAEVIGSLMMHTLEADAQRSLAERGLDLENLSLLLATMSHGPDPSAITDGIKLIYEGMGLQGWGDMNQRQRILALQDDPLAEFYVEGLSHLFGALLQTRPELGEFRRTSALGQWLFGGTEVFVPSAGLRQPSTGGAQTQARTDAERFIHSQMQ